MNQILIIRIISNNLMPQSHISPDKNKPIMCIQLVETILSLSAGLTLIIHVRTFQPVFDINYAIEPVLGCVLVISLGKIIILAIVQGCFSKSKVGHRNQIKQRVLGIKQLIIPSLVKLGLYLSFIILIKCVSRLTFSVVLLIGLFFNVSDSYFSKEQKPQSKRNRIDKKIQIVVVSLLLVSAFLLEPSEYSFAYELHFQIFIISCTCLLLISYFYLSRIIFSITPKKKANSVLIKQMGIEIIAVILIVGGYWLKSSSEQSFFSQWSYITSNKMNILLLIGVNLLHQKMLSVSLKKMQFDKIYFSLSSGIFWYNVYFMITTHSIATRMYLATMFLLFVLLIVNGFLSKENWKFISGFCKRETKKKKNSNDNSLPRIELVEVGEQ